MRYTVIHGEPGRAQVVIGRASSLLEARELRAVSGDVVYLDGEVCCDTFWLWPWERASGDSYALRRIVLAARHRRGEE